MVYHINCIKVTILIKFDRIISNQLLQILFTKRVLLVRMKIALLNFSNFKTEGNAMFGNIPKEKWQNYYPVDKNNLCTWALRSLLIDDGKNVVLIDSGFGDSNQGIIKEYYIEKFRNAVNVLNDTGYNNNRITHVLHTHLHLDHCGGSFNILNNKTLEPAFPNAQYILSKQQLAIASNPSEFEKESFQPEIIKAFNEYNNLKIIDKDCYLFPWLELRLFKGHTEGLIVPVIHYNNHTIVFIGDLMPSVAHLILQGVMGYDINPDMLLKERNDLLTKSYKKRYLLFLQHDFYRECCSLKFENGQILPDKYIKYKDIVF